MTQVPLHELTHYVRNVLSVVRLSEKTGGAFIISLSGDLGAGKTTFVQSFAKELGVHDTVQSPTYVLMKSYPIAFDEFTKLIHIDAYRLEHEKEFAALKPEEFLHDPHAIVCIEWPEKVGMALPEPSLALTFSSSGMTDMERSIEGM